MSSPSFFFYDLETSGLSPSQQRIMQFAGQRTDSQLRPVGEPISLLVKLSQDVLPDPEAIVVTKTTPQKTLKEGISELDLVKLLIEQVFTPATTMVGFNNIRFDDEFLRHLLWRNFYDPYTWAYLDGCSRWDMLDVVRMTRALRPEGINWPLDADNQPTNRLELLSQANNLSHDKAHEAMSDVKTTLELSRLIRQKQPRLFDYLLNMRHKNKVQELVNLEAQQPFVYSSGRFGKQKNFTAVALPIAPASRPGGVAVYDLSVNPEPFFNLSLGQIKEKLFASREQRLAAGFQPLPVKELFFNKTPAVAPLAVVNDASWQRLKLNKATVEKHSRRLRREIGFADKLAQAYSQKPAFKMAEDVESQLYQNFIDDRDKPRLAAIRQADTKALIELKPNFTDNRLNELYLRYKARNFPEVLSQAELALWRDYCRQKFAKTAPGFMQSLQRIAGQKPDDKEIQFILEELSLWLENIAPVD